MQRETAVAKLSALGRSATGVFRGRDAVRRGVHRSQLTRLVGSGVIERLLPDTYRLTAVERSSAQSLRAALLWAGDGAAAAGVSAARLYRLDGVRGDMAEIAVTRSVRAPSSGIIIHRTSRAAMMARTIDGFRVTSIECTLLQLATALDEDTLEIACEDARRRRLTSVVALRAYLDRFGRRGRPGVAALRALLGELDPTHAARSTLEVRARRLLVEHGLADFEREFPLTWNGRTYFYDFAFPQQKTIVETNGRRWHDDATDYEHDNEKWSVPGRHGYRVVFATWDKVTRTPRPFVDEVTATMAAGRGEVARYSPDRVGFGS